MKISAVQTAAVAAMLALACAASAAIPHQRLPASAQVADQPVALLIPYIPRVGQANEGFFSFENYGDTEASVSLWLYDEHGTEVANVLVSLPVGITRWVNSKDLTRGSTSKGVSVIPRGTARSPSLWARVKANGEEGPDTRIHAVERRLRDLHEPHGRARVARRWPTGCATSVLQSGLE